MLILSRYKNERIRILVGDLEGTLTLLGGEGQIQLGFEAPREMIFIRDDAIDVPANLQLKGERVATIRMPETLYNTLTSEAASLRRSHSKINSLNKLAIAKLSGQEPQIFREFCQRLVDWMDDPAADQATLNALADDIREALPPHRDTTQRETQGAA